MIKWPCSIAATQLCSFVSLFVCLFSVFVSLQPVDERRCERCSVFLEGATLWHRNRSEQRNNVHHYNDSVNMKPFAVVWIVNRLASSSRTWEKTTALEKVQVESTTKGTLPQLRCIKSTSRLLHAFDLVSWLFVRLPKHQIKRLSNQPSSPSVPKVGFFPVRQGGPYRFYSPSVGRRNSARKTASWIFVVVN